MTPHDFPESLSEFALIPRFDEKIRELASMAENEDWEYHHAPTTIEKPVLVNYIRYTYKRIAEERKIAVTTDEKWGSQFIIAGDLRVLTD